MSVKESSFGALLKDYRQAVGLTQERLAERAGLSVRTISDLERGINRFPRQETLDLLAKALRLSSRQHALLAASAHLTSSLTASREPQIYPPPYTNSTHTPHWSRSGGDTCNEFSGKERGTSADTNWSWWCW